jgi:hypothetical protein
VQSGSLYQPHLAGSLSESYCDLPLAY